MYIFRNKYSFGTNIQTDDELNIEKNAKIWV